MEVSVILQLCPKDIDVVVFTGEGQYATIIHAAVLPVDNNEKRQSPPALVLYLGERRLEASIPMMEEFYNIDEDTYDSSPV